MRAMVHLDEVLVAVVVAVQVLKAVPHLSGALFQPLL